MKNEKRNAVLIGEAVRTIVKECEDQGVSKDWEWADDGILQELRYRLKHSNIHLISSKEGVFKPVKIEPVVDGYIPDVVYYYLTVSDSYWPDEKRKLPIKYGCVCMAYHKEDVTVSKGYAYCSLIDNFCKKRGRGLAYQRLVQTLCAGADLYVREYLGEGDSFMYVPAIYKGEHHTVPTVEELHTLGYDAEGNPLR